MFDASVYNSAARDGRNEGVGRREDARAPRHGIESYAHVNFSLSSSYHIFLGDAVHGLARVRVSFYLSDVACRSAAGADRGNAAIRENVREARHSEARVFLLSR